MCWKLVGLAVALKYLAVFVIAFDVEELFLAEKELIANIESYIDCQPGQEKNFTELKQKHEAKTVFDANLQNPISNYLIVKRMSVDWLAVSKEILFCETDQNPISINFFLKRLAAYWLGDSKQDDSEIFLNVTYSSVKDLSDAAKVLFRLQETYQLDGSALARGIIRGIQYSIPMSSSDCYWLGLMAIADNISHVSADWLQESLQLHDNEVVKTTNRTLILDSLASVQIDNDVIPRREDKVNDLSHIETYKKLCRGETLMNIEVASRLSCRYVDNGIAYLLIGPLKLEEAFLSPPILIYHDVISDSEIATIQRLAGPRFAESKVVKKGAEYLDIHRVSKSSWVTEDEDHQVEIVNRRASYMAAGLSLSTAEALGVSKYATGGMFLLHHDYSLHKDSINTEEGGNRIATLMFYLSDVRQGGATVFPHLHVAVWPKKGSAVFWYNMRDDGAVDPRTLHAGCPVLIGNKWIANKWFHEKGQEFIRPCPRRS